MYNHLESFASVKFLSFPTHMKGKLLTSVSIMLFGLFLLILHSCSESPSVSASATNFTTATNCLRVSPPNSGATITVGNAAELVNAVQQANSTGNLTILLEDGTYTLDDMLWIDGSIITIRSRSGNRDSVIIRGQGMFGGVSHIFNVAGHNFTVADVTIGGVANHAVQIHSDADNPIIHNVHFVDTGEQMLKVSYRPEDNVSSENGLVEWCLFEYSAGIGPQYYIGGVDAHRANNWIIRHNTFAHIRSPQGDLAEYAIHFWSNSSNTLVEHNVIINCDRGIGFGLGDSGHSGGMIRNNMVYTTRDVGIGLENASGAVVYNNTVFTENYFNSIEFRFGGSQGIAIINNLTNADIASRDGGSANLANNVSNAQASWFVNVGSGDLHLATLDPSVIDQGQPLGDVMQDIDCDLRPKAGGYDLGADEQ